MNKNRVNEIAAGHFRKMTACSRDFFAGYNAEAIHQFRVEYKKLRAFLRMLFFGSASPVKLAGDSKRLYSYTGRLRDLQLQQLLIKISLKDVPKKPQAYFRLLQDEAAGLKAAIAELMKRQAILKSKKVVEKLLPGKLNMARLFLFCKDRWSIACRLVKEGSFNDQNIHSIRKYLKDIFYVRKACLQYFPTGTEIAQINKDNEPVIETLLSELGEFHDCCVGISLLSQQWLINLKTYNRSLLEATRKDWIKKKLRMKRLLINKLKNTFIARRC